RRLLHRCLHSFPTRRSSDLGTALNFGFVILEVIFGIFAHSLALVADAGHNMGDVLGLVLAWVASILARSAPTARRTYGLRSSSIDRKSTRLNSSHLGISYAV